MNYINVVLEKKEPNDILLSEIDSIINGSSPNIHCYILDSFPYNDRVTKLVALFKKLANNGTLTVKFLDIFKICHDYINGKISSKKISEMLSSTESAFNESDVEELVSQNKHMTILKSYHENYYCIIVIQKHI